MRTLAVMACYLSPSRRWLGRSCVGELFNSVAEHEINVPPTACDLQSITYRCDRRVSRPAGADAYSMHGCKPQLTAGTMMNASLNHIYYYSVPYLLCGFNWLHAFQLRLYF